MSGTTARFGLPYPSMNVPADGPGAFQALAEATDEALFSEGLPVGSIIAFAGAATAAPPSWIPCDGRTFNAVTFPALNALLGRASTPDLSDRFLVGASGTKAVGSTGGAEKVRLAAANVPAHTHDGSTAASGAHGHNVSGSTSGIGDHTHGLVGEFGVGGPIDTLRSTDANGTVGSNTRAAGAHSHTIAGTTDSAGSHAHTFTTNGGNGLTDTPTEVNILPPHFTVIYLIKAA